MVDMHVAVAERDEATSEHLLAILRSAGYRATAVGTGAGALERLERAHDESPLALLIVDLSMPDLLGLELLEAMGRSRKVRCPVLVLSEDWDEATLPCIIRGPRLGFLARPYAPEHLIAYLPWALQRRAFPVAPPMRGTSIAAR